VSHFNSKRVINTIISYNNYSKLSNNLTLEDKIKYIINHHLIDIDIDYFDSKNNNKIINKILEEWHKNPINNIHIFLKQIEDENIELNSNDIKYLYKYFIVGKEKTVIKTIQISNQSLPNGIEIINADNKEESENNDFKEEINIENPKYIINISKDILPFIIPLCCLLTIQNNTREFIEMINIIQDIPELLDIFKEQSFIWWKNSDTLDFIKYIIKKYICRNSIIYNICINIKMSLISLLDDKKKLLKYISTCLKPKQIEKKTFGEVFTPIWFIEKMFNELNEYDTECFTDLSKTWLDPAVGMGNFIIVLYYNLMKYLPNDEFKCNEDKKKHILENMIYMSELNKKNCFLVKQILDPKHEYKLNLYNGDSLNLNIKKTFNITKFDYIIGNPPYNEELTQSGAKPLYNKFIEKFIPLSYSLTFVVPSRWFSGGKGLDKFRHMMLNRTDIVYINHFKDSKTVFGNQVDIIGGINNFLIDKCYSNLCYYNNIKIQLNKYDILVDSKYYNLIEKIINLPKLNNLYKGRWYGIESNDKRLIKKYKSGYIKCYVSQKNGFIQYIKKNEIKKDTNTYKVILTEANGNKGCFGNIFIGLPDEVHTGSYISFEVNNLNEAHSLESYLKCKIVNLFLSLRKISQHISLTTCKWIPLVPLDRIWSDEQLFVYFNLNDNLINFVKTEQIIGFKNN
jgi:hypothetical protein